MQKVILSGTAPKEINSLLLERSIKDSGVVVEGSISNSGFNEAIINTFSCCLPDQKHASLMR